MSAFVKLGRKTAREIANYLQMTNGRMRWIEEMELALRPSTKATRSRSSRLSEKAAKKGEKNKETAALRVAAFRRAQWRCECGCGRKVHEFGELFPGELDHFFGKRHGQSLDAVWVLSRECHRAKTENKPAAAWWLNRFSGFAARHGYHASESKAQARLAGIIASREREASHG